MFKNKKNLKTSLLITILSCTLLISCNKEKNTELIDENNESDKLESVVTEYDIGDLELPIYIDLLNNNSTETFFNRAKNELNINDYRKLSKYFQIRNYNETLHIDYSMHNEKTINEALNFVDNFNNKKIEEKIEIHNTKKETVVEIDNDDDNNEIYLKHNKELYETQQQYIHNKNIEQDKEIEDTTSSMNMKKVKPINNEEIKKSKEEAKSKELLNDLLNLRNNLDNEEKKTKKKSRLLQ